MKLKKCKKCGLTKKTGEFPTSRVNGKTYVRGECKICTNKRHSDWRSKKVDLMRSHKLKHPCLICKERDPACLDFHHLRHEDKDFSIGASAGKSEELLTAEIAKCVVLCANCHRKYHSGDGEVMSIVHEHRDERFGKNNWEGKWY